MFFLVRVPRAYALGYGCVAPLALGSAGSACRFPDTLLTTLPGGVVFPLSELRISALIQSALAVLIGGYLLRNTTPEHHPTVWPYVVFGYAFMAAFFPWLAEFSWAEEFDLRTAFALLIVSAVPMAIAANWMRHTPYRILFYGCCGVIVWVVGLSVFGVIRTAMVTRKKAAGAA